MILQLLNFYRNSWPGKKLILQGKITFRVQGQTILIKIPSLRICRLILLIKYNFDTVFQGARQIIEKISPIGIKYEINYNRRICSSIKKNEF